VAGAPRRPRYSPLHRHGLWIQRFLAAPVARCRGRDRRQGTGLRGRRDDILGQDLGTPTALTATNCEWTQFDLGWMYTLFFVLLGSSAAIWGGWLEHAGPRKAGVYAALCWCGGLMISAIGVRTHQLWMLWIGSGVIGGIGLGLGYISPVSTLVKWFPNRRGMATGMAIMGFGGGAMIGSPLANLLMNHFKTPTSVGVWQTFVVLGLCYFVYMTAGAFGYRVPPEGWSPDGWIPPATQKAMITANHVALKHAHKTPQFWLIWAVLFSTSRRGSGSSARHRRCCKRRSAARSSLTVR
jgi:MFS family permease